MTALADILRAQIKTTGPMTVAQYMTACLLHPEHGYYTTREPLGVQGDFTTAPEISQMFGELVGLCLAQSWLDQGAPPVFALAELGPGRGTLMADMLRATRQVPGFHAAMRLHLVEASPRMREIQARALRGVDPQWHDTPDRLPENLPLFAVSNEFFDALPIRQFQRDKAGWREVMIGLGADGGLQMGLSDAAPIASLDHRLEDTEIGAMVETCAQGGVVMDTLASRIAAHGGAALVIDYGDWRSRGDTFQAVQAHRPVDPLAAPGCADLTAHVDFEALATAAQHAGCAVSKLQTQGAFLENLGITARAQTLARTLEGSSLDSHIAAHRRLTHPEEMGSLFKVLAVHAADAPPPPGFET
ncbi:SAM-dependent methyltransferase [Marivita sp. GX14005]|uniref:class I SAM-dependent methyltransferase n=1 Tax=Marivita sp. GX14005 TaxID=2942276 RepID=UPI0020191703|nr:SAM-dependent methyltransferase [Marivita sp. GX14005]MCL3881253.1 SAM-dependent methyltransferase [Marivita sp. GX14005]